METINNKNNLLVTYAKTTLSQHVSACLQISSAIIFILALVVILP